MENALSNRQKFNFVFITNYLYADMKVIILKFVNFAIQTSNNITRA